MPVLFGAGTGGPVLPLREAEADTRSITPRIFPPGVDGLCLRGVGVDVVDVGVVAVAVLVVDDGAVEAVIVGDVGVNDDGSAAVAAVAAAAAVRGTTGLLLADEDAMRDEECCCRFAFAFVSGVRAGPTVAALMLEVRYAYGLPNAGLANGDELAEKMLDDSRVLVPPPVAVIVPIFCSEGTLPQTPTVEDGVDFEDSGEGFALGSTEARMVLDGVGAADVKKGVLETVGVAVEFGVDDAASAATTYGGSGFLD